MQFVPDGPDIPDELLRLWRDGKVIFIAGAGVSMPKPSDLPSFRDLVRRVYEALNDPLAGYLGIGSVEERRKVAKEMGLTGAQIAEAELYFSTEYDRCFAALEHRVDQDSSGKFVRRSVRNAVEVILHNHGGHCAGHQDLVRLSAVSSDGPNAEIVCRITTTNFDHLLEAAASAELGIPLPMVRSHDARMAPRPGAHNFTGIIHLHGAIGIPKEEGKATYEGEFVLSSRDFARVYLRSGVVANYLYDLIRRYTVVLIGYSADDPTMRYLMDAIVEDATLFGDMKRTYAIAGWTPSADDPDGSIFLERWKLKNITPIAYRGTSSDPHLPLWASLADWANWKREDVAWVRERMLTVMSRSPDEASEHERRFVEHMFKVLDQEEADEVVVALRDRRVPFAWIERIQAATDFAGLIEGGIGAN